MKDWHILLNAIPEVTTGSALEAACQSDKRSLAFFRCDLVLF